MSGRRNVSVRVDPCYHCFAERVHSFKHSFCALSLTNVFLRQRPLWLCSLTFPNVSSLIYSNHIICRPRVGPHWSALTGPWSSEYIAVQLCEETRTVASKQVVKAAVIRVGQLFVLVCAPNATN